MENKIAIVDYGVGNLFSLCSSFDYIGVEAIVTSDADEIYLNVPPFYDLRNSFNIRHRMTDDQNKNPPCASLIKNIHFLNKKIFFR